MGGCARRAPARPPSQLADCATDLVEATLHAPIDDMPDAQRLCEELLTLFPPPEIPAAEVAVPGGRAAATGGAAAGAAGGAAGGAASDAASDAAAAEERETAAEAVMRRIGLANPAADLEHVVQHVGAQPGVLMGKEVGGRVCIVSV